MSYRDLVRWYGANSPANLGSAHFPDGSVSPHGDMNWEIKTSSAAYSTPAALVSYVRTGPGTTSIRTDVTLAARYDRVASTLVPQTVTRIDIARRAIDGGGPRNTRTATITDSVQLARITAAFDTLNGFFAHTVGEPCSSPVGLRHTYSLTFRWPGHNLAVTPGAQLCGIGRSLSLDGVRLPETLEGNDAFDAALRAAF